MERRKFVIGLGALAAGGAATTGTGAFSAAFIGERDVDIAVSADDEALIQLVPGHYDEDGNPDGDESSTVTDSRVFLNDDEQLGISFDDTEGGDGVNPNSTYQLGAIGDDAAFYIDYLDADVDDPDRGTGFDLKQISSDDILYGEAADGSKTTSDDPAFELKNESDEEYVVQLEADSPSGTPDPEDAEAMLLTDDTSPISGDVNRGLGVGLNPGDISQAEFTLGSGESVGLSLLLRVGDVNPDNVDDWDTTLEISVNGAI